MSGKKHKNKHKKKDEKKKKTEARKAPAKELAKGKAAAPAAPPGKGAAAKAPPVVAGKGAVVAGKGAAAPGKGVPPAGKGALPPGAKGPAAGGKPLRPKKGGRKSSLALRRGPDGELLAPGDLLLPGGAQGFDEVLYFFRGCAAAEHDVSGDEAVVEILTKRGTPDATGEKGDLLKAFDSMRRRFDGGIEPLLPIRNAIRRNFQ